MTKWVCLVCAVALAFSAAACKKRGEEAALPETAAVAEAETSAPAVDIVGKYVGGGTDPEGRRYTCELEVTSFRTMYDVKRRVDGGEPYAGVGILSENTFAVGSNDGRRYGLVAYNVNADGSLTGISAYEGGTKTGTEELTKK
jgi:hypothetical protein